MSGLEHIKKQKERQRERERERYRGTYAQTNLNLRKVNIIFKT